MNARVNFSPASASQEKNSQQEPSALRRWGPSFALVSAAHVALAVALSYQASTPLNDVGTGAPMVVELAEFVAMPAAGGASAPPPEPVAQTPPEPQPETPPVPEAVPEPKIEPKPEPKLAEPKPREPKPREPKPEMAEVRPKPEREPRPDRANAPNRDASAATDTRRTQTSAVSQQRASYLASQRASWQGSVNAHLERHKRYPHMARSRREEGSAIMRFKMDRRGKILEASLDKSSGYFLLDREIQGVLRRAQPLPAPPPDIDGEVLELVWQVEFTIRP